MDESRLADVDRYIDAHVQQYIDDLTRLVALPSVGAQRTFMIETADLTRELLEKYGVIGAGDAERWVPHGLWRAQGWQPQDRPLLQPL